ncbi:MAG: TetR/AcrR family transcriptional regulator [Candidatus Izimaplasma sp.]|nr:TetR/AcrR family transcriptional regulator [Candidatus Izimaplasma bacterium]
MNRKEEILHALITILKEKGLSSSFTMSDLADKVNIGKSTIYEYFDTKDDVLKSAVRLFMNENLKRLFDREVVSDSDFETTLKQELKYLLLIAKESKIIMTFITTNVKTQLPKTAREAMRQKMEEVKTYYEQRFERIYNLGLKEDILTKEMQASNYLMISSLLTGSIFRYVNAEKNDFPMPLDDYIDLVYQAVLKLAK